MSSPAKTSQSKTRPSKTHESTSRPQALSPLTGKSLPSINSRNRAKRTIAPVKQARRTQAERLAETRRRILAATVSYIDEHGFHQTSLLRVAKAAGVTVGAVQHHFANKAELLTAVVEEGFQGLTFSLEKVDFEGTTLDERISLFIDHCWKHCNSAMYQSNLQILLGMRNESTENFEEWLNETLGHVVSGGFELWRQVFKDIKLSEAEHFDILLYIFSSLSGSALLSRISQHPARIESDLRELKKLLLLRFA